MAIRKIIKRATDSLFVNTEFDGTEAIKPPTGTTAQRANSAAGDIRFNTTTSLMEYYDGSGWKSIDSPPVISSISPTSIANSSSSVNITITGDFFSSGATVKAIGQNLSEIAASSVVFTNSTTLVATFNGTSFSDAQEDYSIEVTNVSGLAGKGSDLLAVNASPAWTVASGSLGTIFNAARTVTITTGATDDEGASLTYAVASGSLPSGLSMSTSTGTITGTASAVGSDTTSSFTLSVTDGTNTTTRAYNILVKAPVITSYTSTGSFTFSVASGVSAVDALVVAGGGGGGARGGGGGGAGGLIYRPAFPVTPGGSVSGTVGSGGRRGTMVDGTDPEGAVNGTDSTFGGLTAKGGGHGGNQTGAPVGPTPQGGSGTGGSGGGSHQNVYYSPSASNPMPNNANQPSQPGDSGTYGFGNQGGTNSSPGSGHGVVHSALGGGGGGAAQAGTPGNTAGPTMGKGGDGRSYDISGSTVAYAGGGGAGHHPPFPSQLSFSTGGSGGGGNGAPFPVSGGSSGQNGTANRGGGGGGCTTDGNSGTHYGGTGGSGVVIISY